MNNLREYIGKNYKKVIGWGTSKYYEDCSKELDISLDYLIDSDESKAGKELDGLKIYLPSILAKEDPNDTLIVIFSIFYDEICETVKKFGDFYTVRGIEFIKFGEFLNISEKNILDEVEMGKGVIISISRNNFAMNTNGLSNFIFQQNEVFNKSGYINVHFFWRKFNIKDYRETYIFAVKNGKEIGMFTIFDLISIFKSTKAVIVHSLATMDLDFFDLIINNISNDIPIIYYLHDFSCICKNIKLMYNDKVFCRGYEDNWSKCLTCKYSEEKNIIFNYHKKLFETREIQIIAPSSSTKKIIDKAFDFNDKVKVIPHQKYDLAKKAYPYVNEKIKIAYVGYKHRHKGWELFKQLVLEFNDKYDFYCFGFSDEILENVEYVDVSFIDDGPMAMTNKLIEYGIDISLLLSVWPETYSYTYYESAAAGTFVITTVFSGNIYDQVRKNKNGIAVSNYEELRQVLNDENKLKNLIKENSFIIKNVRSNNQEILDLITKSF